MLPYTQLWTEQGSDLQLHHRVFAPGVAVGNSHTLQHGLRVVVISLLSGGDRKQHEPAEITIGEFDFLCVANPLLFRLT